LQLSAHNTLNTYIYHLRVLPPTSFGVCYTIFRENNALFVQELYGICNIATLQKAYNS